MYFLCILYSSLFLALHVSGAICTHPQEHNCERGKLISTILKTDVWLISKNKLIRKYFEIFAKFTNEISFDKINEVISSSHRVE
jgi:hypothetical protein